MRSLKDIKINNKREISYSIITIAFSVIIIITLLVLMNNKEIKTALANDATVSNKNEIIIKASSDALQVSSRYSLKARTANEIQNTTSNEAIDLENMYKDDYTTEVLGRQDEQQYISIDEVKISVNMDLTVRTGLSKTDFMTLIANCKADTSGWFEANSSYIYDLCEEYSLNEIFFCGLISAESGWNIASNHRSTHNYISLMANGRLKSYRSLEEGLRVAARTLHNDYLTPGGSLYYGKTLAAMNTRFCGSATWVGLVYGRMQQII